MAFISLLMIVPSLRSRGTGTRILKLVENQIKATGRISEIQAVLARSVIGGLLVSTMITLVLIPVAYINLYKVVDTMGR